MWNNTGTVVTLLDLRVQLLGFTRFSGHEGKMACSKQKARLRNALKFNNNNKIKQLNKARDLEKMGKEKGNFVRILF